MSDGAPRLRAWREAFDLAVEVFRITGRMADGGSAGLGAHMRRTAIRVPALITRAAAFPPGPGRAWDLQGALDCLADLGLQLRARQALLCTDPDEMRRMTQMIDRSLREVELLAGVAGPEAGIQPLARNSLRLVEDEPPG